MNARLYRSKISSRPLPSSEGAANCGLDPERLQPAQPHYETGLSEVTRRAGVPLLAYSPLAFGHLSGKYLNGAKPEGARMTRYPPFGQRYDKPNVMPAVAAYAELARRAGLSAAASAIALVRSRWFCASVIIGAITPAQLRENIDTENLSFGGAVLADLDAVHLRYPNPAV